MSTRDGLLPPIIPSLLTAVPFTLFLFLLLGHNEKLKLYVEMTHQGNDGTVAVGQVFWDSDLGYFDGNNCQTFPVQAGLHRYAVEVPSHLQGLRIDPSDRPGTIEIRRISIRGRMPIPLRQWDVGNGFRGWRPNEQLEKVSFQGGAVRMESTGSDPFITTTALKDLPLKHTILHLLGSLL